jgi:hypothetical protein
MTAPYYRPRRHLIEWAVLSIMSSVSSMSIALAVPVSLGAASGEEPAAAPTPSATVAPSRPLSREAGRSPVESAAPSEGSALGDIVRKSREEREGPEAKKKRSLGTITNETLKKDGTKSTGDAPPGKKGKGTLNVLPAGSMPVPPAGVAGPLVLRDGKGRTEEDWRAILKKNRGQLEKAEAEVKRLELETKRLENDFYAWSDGNYRERVIRPNWDQAREDLTKARVALDAAQASRAELEEEARKSGTPPGWLRDQ